jgi:hypothetical protein
VADEEKVRDLLKQRKLSTRPPLGERTLRRVGGRGWYRFNVCFGARMYARFNLPDPWDPTGGKDEDPLSLGPVSLRLGQKRREPAPHLKPKEPKAVKQADPLAKWRRPAPSAKPAPAPAPSAQPASGAAPAPTAPREVTTPDGRTVRLPVRPDLAHPAEPPAAGTRPPSQPPPTRTVAEAPARPGAPAPLTPDELAARRPPMPRPAGRSSGGRMSARAPRARARAVTPSTPPPPEVIEVAPPPAPEPIAEPVVVEGPVVAPAASTAPPPAPPPRRAGPTGPMGLDDLFGGGMQEGRMRMRRPKKEPQDKGE